MGLPPSFLGAVQVNEAEVLVTLGTSGLPGADGVSDKINKFVKHLDIDFKPYLDILCMSKQINIQKLKFIDLFICGI